MKYKERKIAGIYVIYNKRTDKYYVGRSNSIFSRWNNHLTELLYKRHHNKYLQEDFDTGHYTDFEFSIIKIMSAKAISNFKNSKKIRNKKTKRFNCKRWFGTGGK